MASLYAGFRAVVSALREARVPFALCGGLALAVHGHPRADRADIAALQNAPGDPERRP